MAARFGDPTARDAGRITLNPIPHIDPFGTLLVPGLMAFAGGPVFGWAKPVPVNAARVRNPTRHMAVVALAGPQFKPTVVVSAVSSIIFFVDLLIRASRSTGSRGDARGYLPRKRSTRSSAIAPISSVTRTTLLRKKK